LAGLLWTAAALAQQQPVIRVDVSLVRILATVKDGGGALVGSLERSDFEIYDNGVKQQIAVFEHHTEQPLSVALMVDTSGSTAKELKYEVDSAVRFLKALLMGGEGRDMVALYTFNYEVMRHNNFTPNYGPLERSLKLLHASAGTSLYDAVYLAGRDLEDREGRKVMVIVTDGGDTTSQTKFHGAVEAAQMADAVIYPILVMPITNDAGRNVGGENALTTLASWTGGRVFAPSVGPALDAAFTEIIRELRTQYLLAYYPRGVPPSKDRFHRLEIKVRRPNLRVVHRNGYYGEAEGSSGSPGARISIDPEGTTPQQIRRQQNHKQEKQ
jgi:Ca-activated chloride channel family protein